MVHRRSLFSWPRPRAPAFLLAIAALAPLPAFAQGDPPLPAASRVGVPDALTSVKMIASMLTAIDHANKVGNYTVLHALGSAAFQASNSPASLGATFAEFRTRQIDLADVLVLSPSYEIAPTMVLANTVRMRGRFQLPSGPLIFDLQFEWDNGWRLDGISLVPPPARAAGEP